MINIVFKWSGVVSSLIKKCFFCYSVLSGMAHSKVRKILKSMLPEGSFGPLYSITASLMLVELCLGWDPIPAAVWSTRNFPLLFNGIFGMSY